MESPIIHCPTRTDVQSLKVGDLALDPFGRWNKVVEIFAQKDDIHGKAFVCFYTRHGENGSISHSYKQGEITRTVHLTSQYTSRQIDEMERMMATERQAAEVEARAEVTVNLDIHPGVGRLWG